MKTQLFSALALVFAANTALADGSAFSTTHLTLASLSDVKLTQLVLNDAIQKKQLNATLADTMRLITWDDQKEKPVWGSTPLKIKPIHNVDQPGLGGDKK